MFFIFLKAVTYSDKSSIAFSSDIPVATISLIEAATSGQY